MEELFQVDFENRDFGWEEKFFYSLANGKLKLLNEAAQMGPDGWPYLLVETATANNTQQVEPAQNVFQWLAKKGIGLAVNPQKEYPDYVFTYGMIWNFIETGRFIRSGEQSNNPGPSVLDIAKDSKIAAGAPTEKFLPAYVKTIIKTFFLDQGILQPKILALSNDNKNFDLVFSLDSLNNPPQNEHQGILEAISWFLPPHYSIVLMNEEGLPKFYDL